MLNRHASVPAAATLHIRGAKEGDLSEILTIFDNAVAWLADRGLTGQWGTLPFSRRRGVVEQFVGWIQQKTLYVACQDTGVVGTLVLSSSAPAYAVEICARYPQPALYLEAFATERSRAGQGVGAALLQFAEETAVERRLEWLQLDCWAGNEGLRRYYQKAGFRECETFLVGNWQGVLLEKRVQNR